MTRRETARKALAEAREALGTLPTECGALQPVPPPPKCTLPAGHDGPHHYGDKQ